ncbi:hypothetical protein [Nocardioides alkalitolerans]|uniref:hypothetical protein n=1 Tax=Nocardioides alkalitolerans TaxID=281714 RepID=UPI0004192CC8|nr:hypothetical protein [Nocardioides alkalitolerans]
MASPNITLTTEQEQFLAKVFAENKARYSGFRMELDDDADTSSDGSDGASDAPAGDEGTDASSDSSEGPEGDSDNSDDDSGKESDEEFTLTIEDAKKALSKVRKENGDWRTKYRALEAKYADAKTPEEIAEITAAAQAESAAETHNLLVENIALKHKLPDDLREVLKGDTREELEAHAAKLAKYAPSDESDDPDLSGGLAGADGGGGFDPVKTARALRSNRF